MSQGEYQDHARRHMPGGSDPLPLGGVAMWPMSYDILPYSVLSWGLDNDSTADDLTSPGPTAFDTVTLDATYTPRGYYYEASGNPDHANFLAYMRLGPKGSVWGVVGIFERGPDCGKVTFGWQTISEDAAGQGFDLDGAGFLPGSTDQPNYPNAPDDLVFYKGNSPTLDLYTGAQDKSYFPGVKSQFRIMGDDGARVTADATTLSASHGLKALDGGAGIWVLRAWVDGQNAGSAGFKVRISELRVQRFTSDGWAAG